MLFIEPIFFAFFAAVLVCYWGVLKTNNSRKWFLLGASYLFYGSWDWRFAIMLAAISYGDYFFARQICATNDHAVKNRYVTASVAMNLIVLAVFKYLNFFISSATGMAQLFGLHLDEPTLSIILPVGVSFFTFQSLSYTIDVYRGEISAVQRARDYLLFAAFFPQLVAGPIVRPKYFLPQLEVARTVDAGVVKSALAMFLIGFVKKACIADNVSPYVDQVFSSPHIYSNSAVVTAVWLYATQIYCDFSGYTDMAIAVAALLGYKLTPNFNAPYLAASLQDFWRRWHISLSTWIRDYIYISLGGRKANRWLTYRNLVYTMLAGGLWHGPAWTFVIWGGLHGIGQVVQQEFNRLKLSRFLPDGGIRFVFFWFLTLQFVCICWIIFRATSFDIAMQVTLQYLGLTKGGATVLPTRLMLLPPALLGLQFIFSKVDLSDFLGGLRLTRYAFAFGLAFSVILALLPLGARPFIYFQF
jgi:alginate O-acetyltransferase complex protein AlgI